MEEQTARLKETYRGLPVDRGWAWMVALGSFILFLFISGHGVVLSVFMLDICDHYNTDIQVLTMAMSFYFLAYSLGCGLSTNLLLKRMSTRQVCLGSAVTGLVSTFLMAWTPTFELFALLNVIKYACFGATFAPSFTLVGHYFQRRRSLVSSLVLLGLSLATMLYPVILPWCERQYGFRGSFIFLSGIEVNGILAATFLRPLSYYTSPWHRDLPDCQTQRERLIGRDHDSNRTPGTSNVSSGDSSKAVHVYTNATVRSCPENCRNSIAMVCSDESVSKNYTRSSFERKHCSKECVIDDCVSSKLKHRTELEADNCQASKSECFQMSQASESECFQMSQASESECFQMSQASERESFQMSQASESESFQMSQASKNECFAVSQPSESECFKMPQENHSLVTGTGHNSNNIEAPETQFRALEQIEHPDHESLSNFPLLRMFISEKNNKEVNKPPRYEVVSSTNKEEVSCLNGNNALKGRPAGELVLLDVRVERQGRSLCAEEDSSNIDKVTSSLLSFPPSPPSAKDDDVIDANATNFRRVDEGGERANDQPPEFQSTRYVCVSFFRVLLDIRLLSSWPGFLYTASYVLARSVFFLVLYMPAYATLMGLDKAEASLLVAIYGGVDLASRVIFGYVGDLHLTRPKNIIAVATLVTGVSISFVSLFTTFLSLAIFSAVLGMFGCVSLSLMTNNIIDLHGLDKLGAFLALSSQCLNAAWMLQFPILAVLIQTTGELLSVFFYVAFSYFLAAFLLLLHPRPTFNVCKGVSDKNRDR